ncbi:MAG: aldo/keto reductase [Halioglobus sp.]|mgnify:CR=1 FL=1|nr:aldo/keto reductase [Halioglobus sp.]
MSWLRPLGSSGLQVSALGLGTVKLGRNSALRYPRPFELPDERAAGALLDRARDLGINLLDTAPAYGASEERLGRLLRNRQGQWLLCTKVGEEFADGRSRFDFSPQHTRRSVERSLRRLGVEVIDILLVHSNGEDERIIEQCGTLQAMAELKTRGLVRAVGMSTKSVAGGLRAASLCDVVMLAYNPRQRAEAAVLEACAAAGCGALVKKVLASGHLPAGREQGFLRDSLGLALRHPGTSAALVGTLSPDHLAENVAIAREITG